MRIKFCCENKIICNLKVKKKHLSSICPLERAFFSIELQTRKYNVFNKPMNGQWEKEIITKHNKLWKNKSILILNLRPVSIQFAEISNPANT